MSQRSPTPAQTPAKPALNADRSGVLQRQCKSCGQHTIAGECAACQKKKLPLQRRAVNSEAIEEVPPSVGSPKSPVSDFSRIPARSRIQTKLQVSSPGDRYEQEADRVADQVMRLTDPLPPRTAMSLLQSSRHQLNFTRVLSQSLVQRKLSISSSDDRYERKADEMSDKVIRLVEPENIDSMPSVIQQHMMQRKCALCKDEEQKLQTKRESPAGATTELDTAPAASIVGKAGSTLPRNLRDYFELRFGQDFSMVRVHTDTEAARAARAIKAKAYTLGRDIVFGSGQYTPFTEGGMRLLAHELTHVVQQRGSRAIIQRTVDEVLINCAENQIHFRHDGQDTSYTLNHCDVTEGTYNAQVRLGENRVDFDLDTTPDTNFDFNYSIAPGQVNPNTFFRGQRTVRIIATNEVGAGLDRGSYQFRVTSLSTDALQNLAGVAPSALPEGVMVPLSSIADTAGGSGAGRTPLADPSLLAPAGVGASYFSPTPFSFLPRNSTGVLWTQGHASIWSNPEAALFPTVRGYRGNLGYYLGEMLPGSLGRNFTIRLHEGVPGSFANDALFPLMPGQQSYLYVLRDGEQAARFAETLRNTQHGGRYTYSPPRSQPDPILGEVGRSEMQMYEILTRRGQAPMCTNNCITVPSARIQGAIGMNPTTRSGVDVMSGQGPGGTVDPHYAGRARLMTDAMAEGPLAPGVQRLNIRVTLGGSASMFLIRGGGRVLLVYGIYHTEERIRQSIGTGNLPTVIAEEGGSWAGGILGSALGGAAAGAILCAPTGPVDAVCVIGGFLGGLLFGAAGSAIGSEIGHTAAEGRPPEGGILDTVTAPAVRRLGEFHNYLEYNIRQLYGVPF